MDFTYTYEISDKTYFISLCLVVSKKYVDSLEKKCFSLPKLKDTPHHPAPLIFIDIVIVGLLSMLKSYVTYHCGSIIELHFTIAYNSQTKVFVERLTIPKRKSNAISPVYLDLESKVALACSIFTTMQGNNEVTTMVQNLKNTTYEIRSTKTSSSDT
ncbi:hypothetical protein RF11_10503 [Thelohanellus kitauei]|uniref:Uncharacterized protein n=1 Tax=Thelohanellus kitauei TaxID=669202 RepID=A0A0C2M5I4_THEKT|nr:hypothetical protein RF11_10503 [Thelohanellus kitauei]